MTPKVQATKNKRDKVNHIRIKNLCALKGTGNRVKRPTTQWGKIPASHGSDKGLLSKTYKEVLELNTFKQRKGPEETFLSRNMNG